MFKLSSLTCANERFAAISTGNAAAFRSDRRQNATAAERPHSDGNTSNVADGYASSPNPDVPLVPRPSVKNLERRTPVCRTRKGRESSTRRAFLAKIGLAGLVSSVGLPVSLMARSGNTYESELATFQPWVGESYEAARFGSRTLIVGEADYGWNGGDASTCHNATRELVADLIEERSDDGRLRMSSWIYLSMMFSNKWPYSLDERRRFWNGVAFYNYIQAPAGFGPNGVPTPAQWKNSEAPFVDVVRLLRPQFMAVLGERLWDNLPLHRQIWNRDGIPLFVYTYRGGSCFAVRVRQSCCRVHRR